MPQAVQRVVETAGVQVAVDNLGDQPRRTRARLAIVTGHHIRLPGVEPSHHQIVGGDQAHPSALAAHRDRAVAQIRPLCPRDLSSTHPGVGSQRHRGEHPLIVTADHRVEQILGGDRARPAHRHPRPGQRRAGIVVDQAHGPRPLVEGPHAGQLRGLRVRLDAAGQFGVPVGELLVPGRDHRRAGARLDAGVETTPCVDRGLW